MSEHLHLACSVAFADLQTQRDSAERRRVTAERERDDARRGEAVLREALRGVVKWNDDCGEFPNGAEALPAKLIEQARKALAGEL